MVKKHNKKSSLAKKIILIVLVGGLLFGGYKVYELYAGVKKPNVNLNGQQFTYIYIPTGSNFRNVLQLLYSNNIIINHSTFEWVAEKKNYPGNIKAGKFKITEGMSNNALINLLRSGRQEPVRLVFNKVRTKERFSGIIGSQIEADSLVLLKLLSDEDFLHKYGKNSETAMALFIPNTYEFFWNTDAENFVERMYKEYNKFWNESRLNKAKNLGMTPDEVITLASIVEEETVKKEEKPTLASVYINRLKKGMRLQADPTVRFALGDFEIQRILNKHLELDSPYNTYKHAGLPPGPICIPTITSIDAVLNYEKTNYLYFCARADFSGYHDFSKTLHQHNVNAAKYRAALNRNRIYR